MAIDKEITKFLKTPVSKWTKKDVSYCLNLFISDYNFRSNEMLEFMRDNPQIEPGNIIDEQLARTPSILLDLIALKLGDSSSRETNATIRTSGRKKRSSLEIAGEEIHKFEEIRRIIADKKNIHPSKVSNKCVAMECAKSELKKEKKSSSLGLRAQKIESRIKYMNSIVKNG